MPVCVTLPQTCLSCASLFVPDAPLSSLFSRNSYSLSVYLYSGVRKDADGERLVASVDASFRRFIQPVLIDVVKEESCVQALKFIEKSLNKSGLILLGLINNAGLGGAGAC